MPAKSLFLPRIGISVMRKLSLDELNRLSVEEYKKTKKLPVVVVLDNIRSLSNIGSVFRTADAFRVAAVYVCGITAKPPHRDIHKTALGATESVDWYYFENALEALKKLRAENYTLAAVEQTDKSVSLQDAELEPPIALFFGNEIHGVEDQVVEDCDLCIEVPQSGTKHSLNVSVCAGIVLWHFYRQFHALL